MSNIGRRIKFHYLAPVPMLKDKSSLKNFIADLLDAEGKKIEAINYIFCDDEYLLGINKQYLQHDTYTDIITFEYNTPHEPVVSDIYVSVDRVSENAVTHAVSPKNELLRVVFHGALHLAGYKDKSIKDRKEMRKREDFYLERFVVSRET